MAKTSHLVTLRDIGKVLRQDHHHTLHVLEKHGITPYRTETGPSGRTVRRYKIEALRWAEKWRAEKDAMYAAPAPAPEPEPPTALPPSPAPLPTTDNASRATEPLAQYLLANLAYLMQQHQQTLLARMDALAGSLAQERALNEEARKLLANILDTMTRPHAPLPTPAIDALFNRKDDAGAGH